MSKPIIPLLTAFLALWLFGGAYWLSNIKSKNLNSAEQLIAKNLVIEDGNFKAESSTIFAFQTSDSEIIINDEQLLTLEKLADYLSEASEKQLKLIAYYGQSESYIGEYENLGVARAETIKYLLTRSGAPESRIDVQGKKFDNLILNENGILSGGIEFDIFDKDISNAITEAPFLKEKIFYFDKNKYTIEDSEALEIYAAGLKQYLVDEKDSDVIITGFRENKESKSINQLRAKYVKDIFVNHGIDTMRISLDAVNENGNNSKKVEIKVF